MYEKSRYYTYKSQNETENHLLNIRYEEMNFLGLSINGQDKLNNENEILRVKSVSLLGFFFFKCHCTIVCPILANLHTLS